MQWFTNCLKIREEFCWVIYKPNKLFHWFYICWLLHFHDSSYFFLDQVLSHHLKVSDPNNELIHAVITFLLKWTMSQSSWLFLVTHVDCYHGLYMLLPLYCHNQILNNHQWHIILLAVCFYLPLDLVLQEGNQVCQRHLHLFQYFLLRK